MELRIPYSEILRVLTDLFTKEHVPHDRATICARLLADSSRDGVPSHGLNRAALLIKWIREGTVIPNAPLERLSGFGGLERWDGHFGLGPWNAFSSMARAIELAKTHGIACVALRRTNHWMRRGNYGWQAADAGCLALCFTNTIALMPPWGGTGRRLGNNPLVLAIPRKSGHLVLDMALSQYSMGKLQILRDQNQSAPLPAGFDAQGNPTQDPQSILKGGAALPIGGWKGSGLAILLDTFAATLAAGNTTQHIHAQTNEQGISQTFIAIDPRALGEDVEHIADAVIADIKTTGQTVLYPGERSLSARHESERLGVAVDKEVWEKLAAM